MRPFEVILSELEKITADLGGAFVWTSNKLDLTSPFDSGIGMSWELKRIYFDPKASVTQTKIIILIHEMGHVFACNTPPNTEGLEEWDFLGWEIALAEKIGFSLSQWRRSNSGKFNRLHRTSPLTEVRKLWADRLAAAEKSGLIENGQLRTVRT